MMKIILIILIIELGLRIHYELISRIKGIIHFKVKNLITF